MWFQRKSKINNKKIFFLHIPKCGGTSMVNAISNSLEKNRLGLIKGKGNNPVFFVNPRTSRRCAKLLGDDPLEYRKRILAYNMSINHCKFIYGHFSYSEKIFQEFGKEWNFITILRNPVSQWFSYYFYETRENADRRITSDLKSFIESERARLMGNSYVRRLTEGISPTNASSDEGVKQAIENLNKFALVGILEKMDIFARDYQSLFGTKLVIEHSNKNPVSKFQQKEQITDEIRQRVEEICQPNIRVYESQLKRI
jgi:hypothetical protein